MRAWINNFLPAVQPVSSSRPRYNVIGGARCGTPVSKRKERRGAYARTQIMARKNFSELARRVLQGDTQMNRLESNVLRKDLVNHWRPIFESPSEPVDDSEEYPPTSHEMASVWSPITVADVERMMPDSKTAPGPDGVNVRDWKKLGALAHAILFNIILLGGKIPRFLSRSRTVFIPKNNAPKGPGDYRPITIASVITRHLHKVLASRIQKLSIFDTRQRAFLECDGLAENLTVLQALFADSRTRCRTLHIASLDLSRAFDTVSWDAVTVSLRSVGAPVALIEYVADAYRNGSTLLDDGTGEWCEIRPGRGVKQGDPLSPILFNLVMDRVLSQVTSDVGYDLVGARVNALAFADDVILCASTSRGLQTNLDVFSEATSKFGLLVNPTKSCAVSAIASGREKKVKNIAENLFSVNGQPLPQRTLCDVWRYLGVDFAGTRVKPGPNTLAGYLESISKAPLKPQQRLRILRAHLLPKFLHVWTFSRMSAGVLRALDIQVRKAVGSWIHLPADVPTGYFHAPIRSGGLGLPLLRRTIPILRLRRLEGLGGSAAPAALAAYTTDLIKRQLLWCRQQAIAAGVPCRSTKELGVVHGEELYRSVDGHGLRESSASPTSSWWVESGSESLTGRDYVQFHHVRINSLPTRSRTMRGRSSSPGSVQNKLCRAGCGEVETSTHAVQRCHRTHGGRIARHNAVCRLVAGGLQSSGWNVVEEPALATTLGRRLPDIIATKPGRVVVLDVQVVSSENISLRELHLRKRAKYADIPGISALLAKRYKSTEADVEFSSITTSWRGILCAESADKLSSLGLSKSLLRMISVIVLRGSHMNWTRFNQITTTFASVDAVLTGRTGRV